jgi:hypothetical protein
LKQTVLGWLVGGDEERAILLHNYLAALHYEVYVVLGMAVPEGETAFFIGTKPTRRCESSILQQESQKTSQIQLAPCNKFGLYSSKTT